METALKQRLLGAAVLVALAVVFLPLLVTGPAPDSGASAVSLKVPAPPAGVSGDTRTLDLPLAAPAVAAPATPVVAPAAPADAEAPPPTSPATAAGDYAVNFGSYATPSDAARVIAALGRLGLRAWQEPAPFGVRTVHRVRIGPFATAADAEAARLTAGRLGSKVDAKVVTLDADATSSGGAVTRPATSTAAAPAAAPASATPLPPTPAKPDTVVATTRGAPAPAAKAPGTTTAVAGTDRAAPAATAPTAPTAPAKPAAPPAAAGTGFAIQLGAFANPEEANRLRDRARGAGFAAFVEQVNTDRGTLSRVRVGPVTDRAAADALRAQIAGKLGVSGIVRPHP